MQQSVKISTGVVVGTLALAVGLAPGLVQQARAAEALKNITGILTWRGDRQIDAYRDMDALAPSRPLDAGTEHFPLTDAPQDLSALRFAVAGEDMSLAQYMAKDRIAGIVAIRDGEVRFERYDLGNDADSRWVSFSVAKSVSSMMLGAAIADGYIGSVEDPITDYLPQLRGSAYDSTTIEQALHMSSGVAWNEDYADPTSDVSQAGGLNALALYSYLETLPVAAEPGVVFNYNTGETNLIGGIVRAAIGDNLAHYASRKLWGPFMADDASWSSDADHDVELGGCCINATLRDYARIGQFAMDDGVLPDGTRVLPQGWIRASTSPSPAFAGYGYQWWLNEDGTYSALGIFGQLIWVNPTTRTVIAAHSAWPEAVGEPYETNQMEMVKAVHAALDP